MGRKSKPAPRSGAAPAPAPAPPGPARRWADRPRATLWLFAGIVGVTALLYSPVLGHPFMQIDDDVYVTQNPHVLRGPSLEGVRWALLETHASNWHPLTWLSHMLDVRLFGLRPAGHHATSVILHALAAGLLFLALRRMTDDPWPSLLAAALFALHPLRVESVAWVAERKDVLSGVFWMTTLLAYAGYAGRPAAGRYAAVMASFALGLMAKPMLVTLPLVLLLLDAWPLRRLAAAAPRDGGAGEAAAPRQALRGLVVEKLPLFALALASGAMTLYAQRAGGAVGSLEALPLGARVSNAFVSCAAYLWKTVWPSGLAVFYPHAAVVSPGGGSSLLVPAAASALLLVAATALALRQARSRPYLAVGWLWYLVALLPVIGVIQVGAQARADRYTYVPAIGIGIAVAWGLREWAAARARMRVPLAVAAVACLAVLAGTTRVQLQYWKDDVTLLEHALAVTRGNYFVMNNLGVLRLERGDVDGAKALFEQALPDPDAHNNLGTVYLRRGDAVRAKEEFEAAIRARPGHADALYNLGRLAERQGDLEAARERLEAALRAKPGHASARIYLGVVHAKQGDLPGAGKLLEEAARDDPDSFDAHFNLGRVRELLGDPAGAERHFREALRIRPDSAAAREALRALPGASPRR